MLTIETDALPPSISSDDGWPGVRPESSDPSRAGTSRATSSTKSWAQVFGVIEATAQTWAIPAIYIA